MEPRNPPPAMNDQATRHPDELTANDRKSFNESSFRPPYATNTVRQPKMTHRQPPMKRRNQTRRRRSDCEQRFAARTQGNAIKCLPLRRGRRRGSFGHMTCGGLTSEIQNRSVAGRTADWLSCVWFDLRGRWGGNLADSSLIILPTVESESSKKPELPARPLSDWLHCYLVGKTGVECGA